MPRAPAGAEAVSLAGARHTRAAMAGAPRATGTTAGQQPWQSKCQAVLTWTTARKRMSHVPKGKMVSMPLRKSSKAAR
jgi:hypothetical protein